MITRKLMLWLIAAVMASLFLAGCGPQSMSGSSWPGVTTTDDTVYMAVGSQVFAIDPEKGTDRWRFPDQPSNSQSFFAPPAVSDDLVVVGDYSGNLFGLDPANGSEKWKFVSPIRSRFIAGATIGEKYVYAGTVAGVMYALNPETGVAEWEFPAQRDIWSAPIQDGDTLFFTTLDRHLYALNAQNGDLIWQFPQEGVTAEASPIGPMVGTPNLQGDVMYFGDFNNAVHALNIENRDIKWSHPTDNWVWSSPFLDEETGNLIGGDLDGNLFALNPESGEQVWVFKPSDAMGPVVNNPTLAEYKGEPALFVSSGQSIIYFVDPENGKEIGKLKISVEVDTKILGLIPGDPKVLTVPVYSQPIVYGDLLLIASHEPQVPPLIAYDRETLQQLWIFDPKK